MTRTVLLAAAALFAAPLSNTLVAQHMHDEATAATNCRTFCKPYLYLEGSALFRERAGLPSATSDKTTPLVRGLLEVETPLRFAGLFSEVEFTPSQSAAPRVNYGVRLWLTPRFSTLTVTAGVGGTNRRAGVGEPHPGEFRTRAWGEATVALKVPVHQLSVFAGYGGVLATGGTREYQFGLRHPLAPYSFKLFPIFGRH